MFAPPTVCIQVATLLTRTASQMARNNPLRRGAGDETVFVESLVALIGGEY